MDTMPLSTIQASPTTGSFGLASIVDNVDRVRSLDLIQSVVLGHGAGSVLLGSDTCMCSLESYRAGLACRICRLERTVEQQDW